MQHTWGWGKVMGDLGILPHPSCRDHGDVDMHMQAESPLSFNATQQGGTSEEGGGREALAMLNGRNQTVQD